MVIAFRIISFVYRSLCTLERNRSVAKGFQSGGSGGDLHNPSD
jgi:hypothetical protein